MEGEGGEGEGERKGEGRGGKGGEGRGVMAFGGWIPLGRERGKGRGKKERGEPPISEVR